MAMTIRHDGHTLEIWRDEIEVTKGGWIEGQADVVRRVVTGTVTFWLDGVDITTAEAEAFVLDAASH